MNGVYCICGNRLRDAGVRILQSPCRCENRGPGRSTKAYPRLSKPDWLPASEADKRKRLGVPLRTPFEMGLERNGRWV